MKGSVREWVEERVGPYSKSGSSKTCGNLGDLDLQLVGVGQVVGRDAEAARRDLLDRATARVRESQRVLPALAVRQARAGAG